MFIKVLLEHISLDLGLAEATFIVHELTAERKVGFEFFVVALEHTRTVRTSNLLELAFHLVFENAPIFGHECAVGGIYTCKLQKVQHFPRVDFRLGEFEIGALHWTRELDPDPFVYTLLAKQGPASLTFIRP